MKMLAIWGIKDLSEGGPIISPRFLMSLSKAFLIPRYETKFGVKPY